MILAVGLLLVVDNKILLGKRLDGRCIGEYDTPGGKVNDNELPLDAIDRELLEETNLKVNDIPEYFTTFENDVVKVLYYWCESCIGELNNLEPNKHESWNWYSLEDARKLNLIAGVRELLNDKVIE